MEGTMKIFIVKYNNNMITERTINNAQFPSGNACMNCKQIDYCNYRNPDITFCSYQEKKEVQANGLQKIC